MTFQALLNLALPVSLVGLTVLPPTVGLSQVREYTGLSWIDTVCFSSLKFSPLLHRYTLLIPTYPSDFKISMIQNRLHFSFKCLHNTLYFL